MRLQSIKLMTHIPSSSIHRNTQTLPPAFRKLDSFIVSLVPLLDLDISSETNRSAALNDTTEVTVLNSTGNMIDSGEDHLSSGGILLAETINEESMDPQIEYMGQIAYSVVAPVIISFGILSNILNLVVLSRPSLRGPTFR